MGNCHVKKSAVEGKKKKRDSGLFIMEEGKGQRKGKRNSIVTRTFDECDEESELRTDKITAFLKRSLLSNATFAQEMILRHITPEDMTRIVDAAQVMFFEPGERLFLKHDMPCDNLYIVRRGIFRGLEDETTKVIFREGDVMGETGYFQDCSQILTVVAEGDEASAYCLTKRDFRLIAEKGRDLNNIKLLNGMSQDQKYMLKDTMGVTNYARGDTILAEGALISEFRIILSGSVRVINTTYMQNKYYHDDFCMFPGSYFGEEMFILNNPRSSRTFIALKDVTVCVIDKELFTSEEIFKPAVDQLTCDVTARLKENIIRDAQRDFPCPPPCGRKGLRCMLSSKKNKKQKKVLWKGPENQCDDEDDLQVKTQLPACACGLLPTY